MPSTSINARRAVKNLRQSALICGSVFIAQCPITTSAKVTYDDHVRTVFENKCFSCHNPDKAKGGLDLTTYGAAMAGGSSGGIVSAGSPNDSHLYKVITHAAEPFMPPEGDKLAADKAKIVADWISGGLLENSGSKAKKPKPSMNIALAAPSTGKPEGPPPMPEHLVLEPVVATERAFAPADIASSPWAPLIAIAAPKQVLLYDTEKMLLAGVLPFPEGFPENLAFSRSGQILTAGGGRGGKMGRAVGWEVKTGKRVFEIGNEFDSVLAADLSADHSLVALGGPSRKIRIYTVSDGEEVTMIKKHTDWVTALSFSPDGVLLATGDRNGNLFVWEAATGNPFYTLKGHTKAITAISWRADSNVVASSSEDGTARLWEMNEGKQIKNWPAHAGGVLDLAYTNDGRIVTCGRDMHAKVWDGEGNQKTATKDFADFPVATALTHDGSAYVVGDWTGAVKVFDTADSKLRFTLSANPPTIASRIDWTNKDVTKREAELAAAKKAADDQAKALAAAKATLDKANAEAAAADQQKQDMANALGGAKSNQAKANAERDGAKKQHDGTNAKIAQLNKAIKSASSDANRVKQLQNELAQNQANITKQRAALDAKNANANSANGAVASAQKNLEANKKRIAAAAAAKKKAETDFAARQKPEADAKAKLAQSEEAIAAAKRNHQFWLAADINRQRHNDAKTRPELVAAVEEAEAKVKEVEGAATKSREAANATATALADAQKLVAGRAAALETIKGKLPDLEWELRLAKVITNQKRTTADTIRTALSGAPDAVRPKIETALKSAEQGHAVAETQQQKVATLLEESVPRAEAGLANARAAAETAKATDATAQAEKNTAAQSLAKSKNAHKAATAKLSSFDAKIAETHERYLAALPE